MSMNIATELSSKQCGIAAESIRRINYNQALANTDRRGGKWRQDDGDEARGMGREGAGGRRVEHDESDARTITPQCP